ncbi:hypothetical protein QN360_19565 [Glaciimonas sp. CA11.2]|uniref:hypothetical protein n=1 Tax=unclassified Glaciimonas TaxID=2644401 RepID=UPI002AB3E9BC|nr:MULTISPECIES: hypothetical protein [unclassified Glaciimonas]MDY7547152.1 hypothetical protein [Glaciimonas sp. CA11.2]MEB0011005.1 hypothetical protein [Glaciimonas sp. Cout2]MEB0083264.1 hypothetical protein [Glaciimonas sp. Gout2]MEB0165098.1 hypothetical protein [Glaciimonas sp. CA11.2]
MSIFRTDNTTPNHKAPGARSSPTNNSPPPATASAAMPTLRYKRDFSSIFFI